MVGCTAPAPAALEKGEAPRVICKRGGRAEGQVMSQEQWAQGGKRWKVGDEEGSRRREAGTNKASGRFTSPQIMWQVANLECSDAPVADV